MRGFLREGLDIVVYAAVLVALVIGMLCAETIERETRRCEWHSQQVAPQFVTYERQRLRALSENTVAQNARTTIAR